MKEEVRTILRRPIAEFEAAIIETEAYAVDVSIALREADEEYHEMLRKLLEPKGPDLTDLDRKINIEARTAKFKRERDEWADLDRLLTQRVNVALALLNKEEYDNGE